MLYEDSDSKVTAYETQTGDKVFLQYTDGKIVQKNIIYASNNNVIEQTFYGNGTSFTNEIKVSDYISVDYSLVPSPAAANAMSMGIIRYQAVNYIITDFVVWLTPVRLRAPILLMAILAQW